MTTRAAIYCRLSQDRDGTKAGTERQEVDCRALCRREKFKVVRVYVDDDRSAYNGKSRPAFERMLADLAQYDVLVFWKTDRLVRRFSQFAQVVDACERAGVRLVSVVDPIDTSTPILKGVAGLMASMGEQESKNISLRVTRFHQDAARKGGNHGHRRAYGYELDGMTVVKREATAIKEARDRVLAGESMRSICDDWNRRGVAPVSAPAWRVTTFKRMITGPRIAGLRQYRGEVVAYGVWPAIISPDDHRRVVARLGSPSVRQRGRPASYLLTGMVCCGRCGNVLRATVKNSQRRWACRRSPGDDTHCGKISTLAEPLETTVAEMVLHALDSTQMRKTLARPKPKNGDDPERVRAELELLAASAAEIGVREYLAARKPLEERLNRALSSQLDNGNAALAPILGSVDVHAAWDGLDLDGQRAVLAAVAEKVVVGPATTGRWTPLEDRLDPDHGYGIVWRV
jgi:DNA invertase Pin-like site-specific DNA recombinase